MGWSSSLSQKVILFITILFVALYLFFPSSLYSIEWVLTAFLILVLVFNQVTILSSKWNRISEKVFIKWLFGSAFLVRLIFMLVLLWISYSDDLLTGNRIDTPDDPGPDRQLVRR